MSERRFSPSGPLRGTLAAPPDKSISHRAVLLAAMSGGRVKIRNFLTAADTMSTVGAVRALGADVREVASGDSVVLEVEGVGLRGSRQPLGPVDVGNAGTLMRLLPGWLAAQAGRTFVLDGDESIRRRPVDRIARPLSMMGAHVCARDDRLPPMTIEGRELQGIVYEMPVPSAQVKSCLLLAGLNAAGTTTVVEPAPSRDHTERMLAAAGVEVAREGARVSVERVTGFEMGQVDVPGDFSSAAFWLVAAAIVPGSEIRLTATGLNRTRTALLAVLERMGARIRVENLGERGGEPGGDIVGTSAPLTATAVAGGEIPAAIDELPLVALLGCFAQGETVVTEARELRVKESDRIAAVVDGLRGLGADIEAFEDGFAVRGRGFLEGGAIDARGDHRIAMVGAIAGLASRGGVTVAGMEAADISYPAFGSDLARLAG